MGVVDDQEIKNCTEFYRLDTRSSTTANRTGTEIDAFTYIPHIVETRN